MNVAFPLISSSFVDIWQIIDKSICEINVYFLQACVCVRGVCRCGSGGVGAFTSNSGGCVVVFLIRHVPQCTALQKQHQRATMYFFPNELKNKGYKSIY